MTHLLIYTVIILIYATSVSYCDIKYNKIYNKLTFSFLIIGLLANYIVYGLEGILISIKGAMTGLLILFMPFIFGWIGGGDVKYLSSAGSLVGAGMIVYATLFGLVFSGVASLVYLIIHKNMRKFFNEVILGLLTFRVKGKERGFSSYGKLPLGFFLSLGTVAVWLYFNFII